MGAMMGGARNGADGDASIGPLDARLALDQFDIAGSGLKQMRGQGLDMLCQCARGQAAGTATDHQRAAGEGAPAIGCVIGVTMDHPYLGWIDRQLIGNDLRERGA